MYMFLCSLFVNELYGSSGLFPFLLVQILSDVHIVAAPLCFLQIFCVYSYGSVEFTNLAIMSYDRFVAICHPLQYNTLMTSGRMVFLVSITWLPPILAVGGTTFLSSSLQLCGNVIHKIYCDNHSIIKLACNDPRVNNIYELVMTFLTVCVPVSVIFYTYMRILKSRFNMSNVPSMLRIFLPLYFLTCQPLFNPVLYGLNMSKIRSLCKKMVLKYSS
ncbi:hypothetical protein XENOCAPTIV_023130 [Xenoophorus captivus]|uniref:G-protein coupled receptors family 1 profile domain-containing protein n=1 Tax=Xenoophorus captivus TaxID=1517983 RepID=A0ABV0QB86_9TELE